MARENASAGGAIEKSGRCSQVTNKSVSDLPVSFWKKRQSYGFHMINRGLQILVASHGQVTRIAMTQIAGDRAAIGPAPGRAVISAWPPLCLVNPAVW
jgi:hypothetical protein